MKARRNERIEKEGKENRHRKEWQKEIKKERNSMKGKESRQMEGKQEETWQPVCCCLQHLRPSIPKWTFRGKKPFSSCSDARPWDENDRMVDLVCQAMQSVSLRYFRNGAGIPDRKGQRSWVKHSEIDYIHGKGILLSLSKETLKMGASYKKTQTWGLNRLRDRMHVV